MVNLFEKQAFFLHFSSKFAIKTPIFTQNIKDICVSRKKCVILRDLESDK
jgi:hypothetical protein